MLVAEARATFAFASCPLTNDGLKANMQISGYVFRSLEFV
jgi:hypothetical protein